MNEEEGQVESQKKPVSVRSSSEFRYNYLLEEMKIARIRIDEEIRTMNQFEILSIVAIGLVYWIILSVGSILYIPLIFASFLPVLISAYGIFRYRAHAHIIKINEAYIKIHIERLVFGKISLKGLVKYYDRKKGGWLKYARYAFWLVTFCISLSLFVICVVSPDKIRAGSL